MGSERSEDYYALLGIDPDADGAQLRRVWRRLALRWHPDRAGRDATATFQRISAAYAVLSDPHARAHTIVSAAHPHVQPRHGLAPPGARQRPPHGVARPA